MKCPQRAHFKIFLSFIFGTVRNEIYLIPNGRLLYVVVVGGEDLLPRLDVPLRHQGHDQTKPEVEVTKKQKPLASLIDGSHKEAESTG